jgi:hypothetical protein
VWVETGQMHQRADNIVDHNENTIPDDNNEVGEAFLRFESFVSAFYARSCRWKWHSTVPGMA